MARLETQAVFERLEVDRSESSFGGRQALTLEQVKQGNKLTEKAKQVKAW